MRQRHDGQRVVFSGLGFNVVTCGIILSAQCNKIHKEGRVLLRHLDVEFLHIVSLNKPHMSADFGAKLLMVCLYPPHWYTPAILSQDLHFSDIFQTFQRNMQKYSQS